MKKEFVVTVEEKVFQNFHVMAESEQEVVKTIVDGYKEGTIVVENPELVSSVASTGSCSETIYSI